MIAKIKSIAATALLATALSAPAMAADKGGVQVGGSVKSVTVVKKATNLAIGPGAKASVSIGSFHSDTNIKGSVRQVIKVNKVFNLSKNGSPACLKVGSYGHSPICR